MSVALVAPEPEPARGLHGLDDVRPGVSTLAALLAADLDRLGDDERLVLLVASERLLRLVSARQFQLLASLSRPVVPAAVGANEPSDWSAAEVSAALMVSPTCANDKVFMARTLADRFPTALEAMAAGEISYVHARKLVEATLVLDDDTAATVAAAVLAKAGQQTPSEFQRSLRRQVLKADPAAAEKQRKQKTKERRIEFWPLEDGIAALYMEGPAEDVRTIFERATDLGREQQRAGAKLGIDALRFDMVRDALNQTWMRGHRSTQQAMPITLNVYGAASTLAGLDDEPGELEGYGPIPASVLRELAGRAVRTRLLAVDDDGRLLPRPGEQLDLGRTRYEPSSALRRYVVQRDRRCTFPGCGRPARQADLDHSKPWDEDGHTDPVNLHAACRFHHRAKTVGGWRVVAHPDESRTWISPAGREYHVHPPDQLDC